MSSSKKHFNVDRSGDLAHQNLYLLEHSHSNENDNYRTTLLAYQTESTQTQETVAEIPANYSVLSGNTDPTKNFRYINPENRTTNIHKNVCVT